MLKIPPHTLSMLIENGVIFSEGCSSFYTCDVDPYTFEYRSFKNTLSVPCEASDNIVLVVSFYGVPKFFIDIYYDSFKIQTYDHFLGEVLLQMQIEHVTIDEDMFFQLSTLYDMCGLSDDNINGIFEIARNLRGR